MKIRASLAPVAWAILAASTSCIDERGTISVFFDPTRVGLDYVERGDDLVLRIDTIVNLSGPGEGTIEIDSARVDVLEAGATTSYDDPDITAPDFPLEGSDSGYSGLPMSFEIPSPISDPTAFDAFCVSAGRSVTVTATFYGTQTDRTGSDTPLLWSGSVTVPLVATGTIAAHEVFETTGAEEIRPGSNPNTFNVVEPPPAPILARGVADDVYFILPLSTTPGGPESGGFELYRAGSTGSAGVLNLELFTFADTPRVAQLADSTVIVGGKQFLSSPELEVAALVDGHLGPPLRIEGDPSAQPEYEAMRLSVLAPSPAGFYAVVQSAYGILNGDSVLPAPEGKYYGCFLLEVDAAQTVLSAQAVDRDILSIETDADGTTLEVSGELPPRTEGRGLHIERRDAAGTPIWSHDEPVVTFAVDARSLPDGGALLAYQTETPGGRVELLRIDGTDGSVAARYGAAGAAPTIAVLDGGGALLTFTGVEPSLDLPARPVPIALEISPSGEIVRGEQLSCAGWSVLGNTGGGAPVLVGAFEEYLNLGATVRQVNSGAVWFAPIE